MKLLKFSKSFQRVVMTVLIPSFATVSGPVQANPAGPSGVDIDAGNVAVSGLGTATVDINNFNQHAIVNWDSFSIQQGETARFNQGANAAILNRVITNNPTEIYGRLEASQGNVFLLNPNGILVGAGGVVDVAGLMTMSTLDVDDTNFRNGGDLQFSGSTTTGITNFGTISSTNGDVVLMGGFVDNKSGGQIGALNGTVAIGSGGDIILHEGGGTRISVRGSSDYEGTGIDNQGGVRGASVEMKAHGNVYALAINNGGAIRATGADRSNGRVRLQASGGSSNINLGQTSNIVARAGLDGGNVEVKSVGGSVAVNGEIDARGTTVGGDVLISANTVTQSAGSLVNASGAQAGGKVKVDAVDTVTLAGKLSAEGVHGSGGEVTVTSNRIIINDGADLSADGATTGGLVRVGGDFQGRDTGLREADSLRVEAGATLSADSLSGNAGTVIAWSNQDTIFVGDVSASAKGAVGNGGMVEISGKEFLYFDGSATVNSVGGESGTVLFDPGDVVIGAAIPAGELATLSSPVTGIVVGPSSLVSIRAVNNTLQSGANVLVVTQSGSIFFDSVGATVGGSIEGGTEAINRHSAVQWTNSNSSFGAFASGSISVNNHIRTSGAGSINLLAGWTGTELDPQLLLSPQAAWDYYLGQGAFGNVGGSVTVGSTAMARHVEVGSRFGDTNVAGFSVTVQGSNTDATLRYGQIGFHDGGQAFAPRLDRGAAALRLDLTRDASNTWYLSDGRNLATGGVGVQGNGAGVGDPIAAVVGMFEVDKNADGIVDGVLGINSSGALADTFIPYASHYNSVSSGNWWWQQIEADATAGFTVGATNFAATLGSIETQDPLGLGGLRPEFGAGIGEHSATALALVGVGNFNGADINVIARSNVIVQAGSGNEETGAMIGHGGANRANSGGSGISFRDTNSEDLTNAAFSNAGIENNQIERRWSFNGTDSDRTGTSIARLAPVYGNINVFAGVNSVGGVVVDHPSGTVTATLAVGGNIDVKAAQAFDTTAPASNSSAMIGHGGIGQFGEFYGNIEAQAGGSVNIFAGEATRSAASIGHTFTGHAYWNPTNAANQQLRFFATAGDFDNPNLRRGELFSGINTTGFDPAIDPARLYRYTLGDGFADATTAANVPVGGSLATSWTFIAPTNGGNYVPERLNGVLTGRFVNITNLPGNYTFRTDPVGAGAVSLRVINMNPLLYTRGIGDPGVHSDTTAANSVNSQGRASLSPLTLSRVGTVTVAALDGSIVNGFHGDINVRANSGSVTLTAYMTQGITVLAARDTRFAAIGHGGRNFAVAQMGAGYVNLLGLTVPGTPTMTGNPDGRERVTYRIGGVVGSDGDFTGSRSDYGAVGAENNRSLVNMSMTGDIDVYAGGNLTMTAGNDVTDYTRIGHGGSELADYETSSFVLGDIKVQALGRIDVIGGGGVQPINRGQLNNGDSNYDLRAWSQIGHGGFQTGFMGFLGDIDVQAGGNIRVQNGAFSLSFAKIGHQGTSDFGQSGGSYQRSEMFRADKVESDIVASLTAGSASVIYSKNADATNPIRVGGVGVLGVRNFTASGAGTSVGSARNTANINVRAGGSVTLDHKALGERQPLARLTRLGTDSTNANYNAQNQALGIRNRNSFAQIGHGGIATIAFGNGNRATNYGDKIGNISVVATGGNISLTNGEGFQRWSRIGHGVGANDSGADATNVGFSRAIELAGDISVSASADIILDASAADDDEKPAFLGEGGNVVYWGNINSAFGANGSVLNPVSIGHGGVDNNTDLVVLSQGEDVNGIAASSNITAVAGVNMSLIAGNGVDASSAQLGHGQRSDLADDAARRFGIATGFAGDIDVRVTTGNLLIQGGANAWNAIPASTDGQAQSTHGNFAAIGHGGYMMDAPSLGDISVYVGNDLDIIAQVRTDARTTTTTGSPYFLKNLAVGSDAVASAFNFAKIGHFSVENGDRTATAGVANFSDIVNDARLTGDITVVVGNDLTLAGGTINVAADAFEVDDDAFSNVDTHTIYGAFAQIGHGGPAIGGDLTGDITVLVDGNISVSQGANLGVPGVNSINPSRPMNNYAMIGNGDYLYGVRPIPLASDLFRRHAQGFRSGDIVVAAGNSASFDGALIGHADPQFASGMQLTFGNTQVAVSRVTPFYDPDVVGFGTLTASNGTIFSSGGYGTSGSRMEIYAPSRSRNKLSNTTRINEAASTFIVAPGDFAADNDPDNLGVLFNAANGKLAGRNDEVYLTPDLWWDDLGVALAAGIPGGAAFPTSATGGQGGSIANVVAPGGLPNLTTLTAGALGASADIYRDNNGVSGAGFYTLYYDAIEDVSTTLPIVIPPFTGSPIGDYDFLDRSDGIFGDGYGGGDDTLNGNLGIFEADESTQEGSGVSRFEDAIDNAFGPRQDSTSEEEEDEERRRRKRRAAEKVGPIGLTFYVFDPATNRLSSYRVFGNPSATLAPAN